MTFTNRLGDEYQWQIFRNPVLNTKRNLPLSAWFAAEQKMEAHISDSPRLQAALAWQFQHTVNKCWCSEEIKQKCFENAGSDESFAFIYFYCDDTFAGPSNSGYSSD
jgi:hypothetical protein